jgi:peptidoglycan-associated lipoprotein
MTFQTKPALHVAAAVLLAASLAACASKPKPGPAAGETGPAPSGVPIPPPGPETFPAPPTGDVESGPVRPGTVRDFVVNAGDRVYFDYDQFSVRADAAPVLDAQASWLARYPSVRVRIEGNADERGTREYNFALAGKRAQSVMDYLVSKGVSPSRITTVSYGKERPIDSSGTEEGMAKNRNGHTSIVSGAR